METIKAVIFDYGFTLSSEYYFNVPHPDIHNWKTLIQRLVFSNNEFCEDWMRGKRNLEDVAALLAVETQQSSEAIVPYLRRGCMKLKENPAVIKFARELSTNGIQIAMVTGNFDMFNQVVVPYHGYDQLFPVILNSYDYGETDKTILWPKAFSALGDGIDYCNALLVEDGKKNIELFRKAGGFAIEYTNDKEFARAVSEFKFANKKMHLTKNGCASYRK